MAGRRARGEERGLSSKAVFTRATEASQLSEAATEFLPMKGSLSMAFQRNREVVT
jgi:hypothetical protein